MSASEESEEEMSKKPKAKTITPLVQINLSGLSEALKVTAFQMHHDPLQHT